MSPIDRLRLWLLRCPIVVTISSTPQCEGAPVIDGGSHTRISRAIAGTSSTSSEWVDQVVRYRALVIRPWRTAGPSLVVGVRGLGAPMPYRWRWLPRRLREMRP